MNTFFLNWQDPETRNWYPVGKLQQIKDIYLFSYTKGAAISPRFTPFGNMYSIGSVYVSKELFPIFANRVMSERRPEFLRYAHWSGLDGNKNIEPLILMARMGGVRATDTLQVYSVPERSDGGLYKTVFFCHGISHLGEGSQTQATMMRVGDRLFPMLDVQNPFDSGAVALRSSDPATMLGFCPRYLAPDIRKLLKAANDLLVISVKQINYDAPSQYRMLCEASTFWPNNFKPCDDVDHETIVQFDPMSIVEEVTLQKRQGSLW